MAVWSEIKASNTFLTNRLDAEFFQPKYVELEERLSKVKACRLERFLTDIRYGLNVPPEYTDEGLVFIRALNLKEYGIEGEILKIPYTVEDVGETNIIADGDLLVVRSGANVGDVGVVTEELRGGTFGSYVIRLQVKDISPYYLYVFLKCLFGREQTVRFRSGAAQPNISIPNLKELMIYAPLEHQQEEIERLFFLSYQAKQRANEIYSEAENLLLRELGLVMLDLSHELTYERNFSEVAAAGRYDAQYFHPEKQHILEQLAKLPGQSIGSYFTPIDELLTPTSEDTGELVQNYDLTEALRFFLDDIETTNTFDLGSAKKRFKRGDVVVSRLRSYLKEIAIVETSSDAHCVGSSEFIVLRPGGSEVSAELLVVYLRSTPVQNVLKWCQDGSNHPRFKEEELLSIKLPDRILTMQDEIVRIIRAAIQSYSNAKQLLEDAKRRVEQMIVRGESSHVA
jgi:type I restriction enzyme S subunit